MAALHSRAMAARAGAEAGAPPQQQQAEAAARRAEGASLATAADPIAIEPAAEPAGAAGAAGAWVAEAAEADELLARLRQAFPSLPEAELRACLTPRPQTAAAAAAACGDMGGAELPRLGRAAGAAFVPLLAFVLLRTPALALAPTLTLALTLSPALSRTRRRLRLPARAVLRSRRAVHPAQGRGGGGLARVRLGFVVHPAQGRGGGGLVRVRIRVRP